MHNRTNCGWMLALITSFFLSGCGKPVRSSSPGAATPEELVERFVAAIRSDDPEATAALTAAPGDERIRAKERFVQELRTVSQALEKQCTETWGPSEQTGPLYHSVLAQRAMDSVDSSPRRKSDSEVAAKLVKQEALPDGQIKLILEITETWDGQTRMDTDSLTAVKTAEGWKIAVPQGLLDHSSNSKDSEQRLLEQFRLVTKEIQDGLFQHRGEVDFLMARELINYQPDVLTLAQYDGPSRDDAERLGLRPAPDDGREFPPIRVEVTPAGDAGTVRLRVGDQEQESSPDLLAKQIEELSRGMRLPKRFPIVLAVRQGIAPDFLIRMLQVMLDVRALEFQPGIGLQWDAPAEFHALAPQLTGRLRLYTIAAPKVSDPLRPETDDLSESREIPGDIEDLKSILERDDPLTIESPAEDVPVSRPDSESNNLTIESIGDPGESLILPEKLDKKAPDRRKPVQKK